MSYDIDAFQRYTGLMPGDSTYAVDDLRQLWVFCRGDRAQLEKMAGYTPFTLQDDIFVLGVGDFSSGPGWADASIVLPIVHEGVPGGTFFYEYEDQHTSVAMGRETWGYPKAYTRIECHESETEFTARVSDYDTEVFSVRFTPDDSIEDAAWRHIEIYPQMQVRAVPQPAGPGFDILDVVSRDPSRDYVPRERRLGRAEVEIGTVDIANGLLQGEPLRVVEVLGAELRIGDYRSTAANGVPRIVTDLLRPTNRGAHVHAEVSE